MITLKKTKEKGQTQRDNPTKNKKIATRTLPQNPPSRPPKLALQISPWYYALQNIPTRRGGSLGILKGVLGGGGGGKVGWQFMKTLVSKPPVRKSEFGEGGIGKGVFARKLVRNLRQICATPPLRTPLLEISE